MGVCQTQKIVKGNGFSDVSAKTQQNFYTSSSNGRQSQLFCPQSHSIQNMCINPKCHKEALYCSQTGCPACQKSHPACQSVKLSEVVRIISKRSKQNQQFIVKIAQVEREIIQTIKQRMNAHLQKALSEEVDHKYSQLVNAVYFKKSEVSFQGCQAEEFFTKLNETDAKRGEIQQQMLSDFKRELQKIALSLNNLQRDIISQYIKKSKIYLEESSKKQPSETHSLNLPETPQKQLRELQLITTSKSKLPVLDSRILSKDTGAQEVKLITQCLNNPKEMKLLFRASEHGFQASSFHEFCDNIPHTMTIIRTQFGKTIVGYTPLSWNSATGFAVDETGKSFLLSLDMKKKMSLTRPQKTIQCIPSYGPVFGGGSDIAVADQCNKTKKSCTNFPYSYNCEAQFIYGQESWEALCGVQAGKYFNVTEYQVFRVDW